MTTKPKTEAQAIEAEITKRIAAAGIRLRFDRVALRLVNGLKAGVVQMPPADETIMFTVTAPIRHPAKTEAALQRWLRDLPPGRLRTTINGNELCARKVRTATEMPKVIGFVHNPESNADLILDLAESSLSER